MSEVSIANKVCFECKIAYLVGNKRSDYSLITVCDKCKQELTKIHNSIKLPKKHNKRAWKNLYSDYHARKIGEYAIKLKLIPIPFISKHSPENLKSRKSIKDNLEKLRVSLQA
jgi:hypothetical protein